MKLASALKRIIAYSFYALFFFTPLLFNPSRTLPSYELFEWNKMIFVYALTTIIIGAWLARMVIHRRLIVRRSPFDIPLALFIGSQALSTLFSIDRHVSIFGYYSRFHGGLLSTICYGLLYMAWVANRSHISLKKLLTFALASGAIVGTYGILERFGIDAHMWVQDVQSRVFSTLGQPNWLAAYVTVLLPITLYHAVHAWPTAKTQLEKQRPSLLFIGYTLLSIVLYTCLLFTKSRSGFLGFWSANGIFWLIIGIKSVIFAPHAPPPYYCKKNAANSKTFLDCASSHKKYSHALFATQRSVCPDHVWYKKSVSGV